VADGFGARVAAVPPGRWDDPSPCEGWVARDVVRHLVGWVPSLLHAGAGVELAGGPAVDDDPAGAWRALDDGLQRLLDDPDAAARPFSHPQAGDHRLDEAIDRFVLGDVLVHTWDLARATGLDDRLDPDEVARMLPGVEGMGEALVASGHYGPAVAVAGGADPQDRLLALLGRTP
jgi:uncharacterized protein (TIGR03086 family)